MRLTKQLLLIASLMSGKVLMAQQNMTLQDAIKYGMEHNYTIRMSQQDFEKSEKKVREVLALGLPQVNANGQFTNYLTLPTTVIPASAFNPAAPSDQLVGVKFGTDYAVTGAVTASQLLFDGSYIVGLQATKNLANLSRLNIEKTARDAVNDITQAYYTAIVADENVKTIKSTLELTQKLYDGIKKIFENGLNEQQDVDQVQLTVSNIQNSLARAELMQKGAYLAFKLQIGMNLDTAIVLTDNLQDVVNAINLEAFSSEAFNVEQNVDYQMLETQITLNQLNMKNEKMKYYPSLNAFFTQQYQAYRLKFDFFANKPWYPSTFWGLQMQVPVFSSGMRNAKVAQNRIELEKSKINLEQLDQALKVQAYMARTEFLNAVDAYQLQKQSLALAESIQDKTMIKYKEGLVSSLDLTQTQNQYLTQQVNYINSLFNMLAAKAKLEKILSQTKKQ